MFGNREVHRKLSGTGGYAAGRLAEISESLGQLAKVMKNSGEDPGLSREDGSRHWNRRRPWSAGAATAVA